MATRRPDTYLLSLLVLWDVIPLPLAEMLMKQYDVSMPISLEAGMDWVHDKIHETIAAMPEDDEGTPALPSGESGHADVGIPRDLDDRPPVWFCKAYADAYAAWNGFYRED